jgi:hypothetical protein
VVQTCHKQISRIAVACLRWLPGKKCHTFTPLVATKVPGGILDSGTAFRSHAVVQFDNNDSHVPDPRAGLKHFYFGTFNVYLQQVIRLFYRRLR